MERDVGAGLGEPDALGPEIVDEQILSPASPPPGLRSTMRLLDCFYFELVSN